MPIKELDRVVLTARVPAEGLEVGDVGTIVHAYDDGAAFEIEFTTLEGARQPLSRLKHLRCGL